MKTRLPAGLVLTLLTLIPFAATSCSGSGSTGKASVECGAGEPGVCLTSCNLGCSVTGCSINEVFQNQPIILTFNQDILPSSVDNETVQIRTAQGREPVGSFFVQNNVITFVPEVKVVQTPTGPELDFGFAANETYVLTIPDKSLGLKTITARDGGPMLKTFTCTLFSNGQIKDFDGKAPCASMIVPANPENVPVTTPIVIEFTELINTTSLFGQNGELTGVTFGIAQFDSQGVCSNQEIPLPGAWSLSTNKATQRTVLTFQPAGVLPGDKCVRATLTQQVQDLSGKRACFKVMTFKTSKTDIKTFEVVETFADAKKSRDDLQNGAVWTATGAVPVTLGGSGMLGEFDVRHGQDTGTFDAAGRKIYDWSTDNQTIPGTTTLSGRPVTVSNGVFEFTSFLLDEKSHIRFKGTSPVKIKVTGTMRVEGAISVDGEDASFPSNGSLLTTGQDGRAGGPGGAQGGQGGDSFGKTSPSIDGKPGKDIVLPTGHPLASVAAGTGGGGSKANPTTSTGLKYSYYDFVCAQISAGGAGGGFLSAGGKGTTRENSNSSGGGKAQTYDFGPDADGGKAVSLASILGGTLTEPSSFYFQIGGAGGGGSGSVGTGSIKNSSTQWSIGTGGAGGGGLLHVQVGGTLIVPSRGEVSAQGGSGFKTSPDSKGFHPVPGGAGSGGSILMQTSGILAVNGKVSVLGGTGGQLLTSSGNGFTTVDGIGGAGGYGFIRIEADPKPDYKSFDKLEPTTYADNAGLLRAPDYDKQSMVATLWYDTGLLFPPRFNTYEIQASVDGNDVVFTDAENGQKAVSGQPIVVFFQGGQYDSVTKAAVPGTESEWHEGTVNPLSLSGANTFRILILLDGTKAIDPSKTVVKKRSSSATRLESPQESMMKRLFSGLALFLGLVSCSGGGGDASSIRLLCKDAGDFCVVGCNLGCTLDACSLGQIAENQPLVFEFSRDVDPGSLTSQSFQIRTATGMPADGQFVVDRNRVSFVPSLRTVNGVAIFGFRPNETYTIRLTGGAGARSPILSTAGAPLGHTLECQVTSNLGIIDLDGQKPAGKMTTPNQPDEVSQDTLIILEFTEILNTQQFAGGGAGNGITYSVITVDRDGNCNSKPQPLPGTVSHVVDTLGNKSTVIFRPAVKVPSKACVKVRITDQLLDLSGKGAVPAEFSFRVKQGSVNDQYVEETFASKASKDASMSGAVWGDGKLVPGKLGGTGIHGTFKANSGTLVKKEGEVEYYQFDTDKFQIPLTLTLHGEAYWQKKLGPVNFLTVTNGRLEFSEFKVLPNEVVIFKGKNFPEIRCIGDISIEGQIILEVNGAIGGYPGRSSGKLGSTGSLGGASGGQGGDSPKASNPVIAGRPGGDVVLPAGHPRTTEAKGTGGPGSPANPPSGKDTDTVWFGVGGWGNRQTAAGGTGGCLWSPDGKSYLGTQGVAEATTTKPLDPYNSKEFGAAGAAGKAFPVLPVVTNVPSSVLFRIGGSGGGGGGANTCGSFSGSADWRAGHGGGAGGGILHLMAGNDVDVVGTAKILCNGGPGSGGADVAAVVGCGAGGSGGSILVQAGGLHRIAGELSVLGGKGGTGQETSFLQIRSTAGDGGAGMIRIEADPSPDHKSFANLKPAATADNVGLLRDVDYDPITVGTSNWYNTKQLFAPLYVGYRIEAKVDDVPVVYSDMDTQLPKAVEGEPIVFLVQSVQLDLQTGKPRNDAFPTVWYEGDMNPVNVDDDRGNGFRFMLRLDTDQGKHKIEVTKVRISYRG
ncbi:MAG: Ig-like domain-containing protein [Planctomycetota bacterium]